jgi:hypothetical protein
MTSSLQRVFLFALLFACAEVSAEQIAVIPDTQSYTKDPANHALLLQQTQWIAENSGTENIAFITHVGDVIQSGGGRGAGRSESQLIEQWQFADENYKQFDGSTPYSIAYGNHDFDTFADSSAGSSRAQSYFGASRYEMYDWFGGSSPDGENFYQFFEIGGQRLMHVAIKFQPDQQTLDWVGELVRETNLPTIISTHAYLVDAGTARGGGTDEVEAGHDPIGETIWNGLVRSTDQIFMVICGHNHSGVNITVSGEYSEDGEHHQISFNDAGREVYEILADYQDYPNGGDGWFQLVDLDPDAARISVRTWSPFLNKYQEDPMSQYEWHADLRSRWQLQQ